MQEVRNIFPDFLKGFAFDLVPKEYNLYVERKQQKIEDIYTAESTFRIHLGHAKRLIDSLTSDSPNPVAFGKQVWSFLAKYYSLMDGNLLMNGIWWKIVRLPHSQYL